MKSSKRGKNSAASHLSVVHSSMPESGMNMQENTSTPLTSNQTISPVVISTMEQSHPTGFIYGWKPDHALAQISFRPDESWLIYQAQSILRKQDVTLDEAKELFKNTDISTRHPRRESAEPRRSGFLAALRAMVCGGMILVSGCAKMPDNEEPVESSDYTTIISGRLPRGVVKFYDRTEGTVCYVARSRGVAIACMVAKPGDNQ